ncbi:cytoskeleton-associated protein 5-like [Pezoporus flaviventris]|uniref:cytoskeleton-associated protein 5-like n=1 Tax=Pezoporus flaviventris TaxID=889875 RepID=UPI002AAF41DF|nr:cytoskeleton-associated protein 5-like [Pezoporus flaviventris]
MSEPELSAEECREKAAAVLPETCIQHLESNNWKERISSMDTIQKTVREMKTSEIPCQALVRLLLQGHDETKLQVMQKKIHTITLLAQKGDFSRTSAQIALEIVVEMVGDVLCSSNAQGTLTAIAEACSLPWTAKAAMSLAFSQNNSRIHSKVLDWTSKAILEFGFEGMEAKALVKTLKIALAALHSGVQRSAITLLGVIYLYMGDSLRALIESEELPLLPQVDAELKKLHGQVPPIPSRANPRLCPDDRVQEDPGNHRRTKAIDISDRITPELESKLLKKNWTIQREGLEEVAVILQGARFIQPNIGELPGALRACLCNSNPIQVQMTLRVLQQLSTAMGSNVKQHMKDLGFPLIALFRESKSNVRAAALAAVNAWAAQMNILEWLDGQDISKDPGEEMPLQKQELMQWLVEQLPTLKSAPSDLLRCVPHLYSSLQDSNRDVQRASQAALPFFIMHLGFEKMAEATSGLKAAAKDHVLAILENVNDSLTAQSSASAKSLPSHPRDITTITVPSILTTPPAATTLSSQAPAKEPAPNSSREENRGLKELESGETVLKGTDLAKEKAEMNSTKKDGVSKLAPIFIIVPSGKEQRMRDEKSSKVLQWNFRAPSDRYVKQLKAQMNDCVSSSFQVELFHPSFPHHIKALAIMAKHLETEKEGVISCLDLILKWLTLRFFDTNTWVLFKSLDYLNLLLNLLIQEKYQLMDNEAVSFLPYLILKMGEPRQTVLRLVHAILKRMCLIYPPKKVFGFLMEGIKSNNTKQKEGCLVEMGYLLETYGLDVCEPSPRKALKTIAVFLGDQHIAVHKAALNIMVTACKTHGEALFKMIGDLPKEHMRMLGQTAKQEPDRSRVSSAKHFSEKPQHDSNTRSEVACKHAGDAPSKPEPTTSQGGNFNMMCPQPLPPKVGEQVSRLVSRKYSLFRLKGIIQLETIPEFQTLPISSDTDDTCHNITSTINSLICRISSDDTDTSIQAMKAIEMILRENKVEAMSGYINEFLVASFQSLKFINQQQEADDKWGKEQIILQCNCVIQACTCVFRKNKLAQEASVEVLKVVMSSLSALMLDLLDGHLEKDQKLMQSIKVLVKRVLEKSDQTRIICALLKLLQDSLTVNGNPGKFSDLLAKCLLKTTQLLPATISIINLDEILLNAHTLMMKALPNEKLRQHTNKLPLWALKTLLHHLGKLKGVKILDHLTLIDDAAGSEVEAYLQKTVSPVVKQEANKTAERARKENPRAARRVAKDKAGEGPERASSRKFVPRRV